MRDPYGPGMIPDPYDRMGGGPIPPREPVYDRPAPNPRPLTPPMPLPAETVKERTRDILRDGVRERESLRERERENLREKERKEKLLDMEIIVVNRQQK